MRALAASYSEADADGRSGGGAAATGAAGAEAGFVLHTVGGGGEVEGESDMREPSELIYGETLVLLFLTRRECIRSGRLGC